MITACYRLAGALDSALSLLKQARSIESGLAEIYREQGAIFQLKSQFEAAKVSYNQYLLLAPNAVDKKEIKEKLASMENSN